MCIRSLRNVYWTLPEPFRKEPEAFPRLPEPFWSGPEAFRRLPEGFARCALVRRLRAAHHHLGALTLRPVAAVPAEGIFGSEEEVIGQRLPLGVLPRLSLDHGVQQAGAGVEDLVDLGLLGLAAGVGHRFLEFERYAQPLGREGQGLGVVLAG